MKFLCDGCSRLVELRDFAVREGALLVSCPACRHEGRVPPPEAAGRPPAPVLELARPKPHPAGPRCPKCGAGRAGDAQSCARCGLVFALFRPETLALPEALEASWRALETTWTDAERHAAFLASCTSAEVLGEAVRRYRLKAEQAPGDALASRFRDDAVSRLMAHATLLPDLAPGDRPRRPSPVAIGAALVAVLGLGALVFWLLKHLLLP